MDVMLATSHRLGNETTSPFHFITNPTSSTMDRLYSIRHTNPDIAYRSGDCDVCYQRNVKVRPLQCGEHFFCQMCAEFVPRLLRGDSTCRTCSDTCRWDDARGKDHIDRFLSDQTGEIQAGSDCAVSLDGEKILSFEGDPDDTEFDGNNAEWDELLRSMPEPRRKPTHRNATYTGHDDERPSVAPIGIPRKVSRLRLGLSSTDDAGYTGAPLSCKQPISNNVTELIHAAKYAPLPPYIPRKKPKDIIGSPSDSSSDSSGSLKDLVAPPRRGRVINSPSGDSFDSDSSEMERCTSPVKVPRRTQEYLKRRRRKLSPEEAELSAMMEEIGDIEGPDTSSGGSNGSRSTHYCDDRDVFWEF